MRGNSHVRFLGEGVGGNTTSLPDNSRGEHGDAFDFAGRYLLDYGNTWNSHNPVMFVEAARCLAERAGLQLGKEADFRQSAQWGERELVARLHEALVKTPAALDYITRTRGWRLDTVHAARLGFIPGNRRKLLDSLNLPARWCDTIEHFPADMLVYPHFEAGRLAYLSGRSIEGKRHYNPPREVLGERQPYFNRCYQADSPQVVVVEDQADAVTFGEWQLPAVALTGMTASDMLLTRLRRHPRVFILLDNVAETDAPSRQIAQALGAAKVYVPKLPEGIKDVNDWLLHGADQDTAEKLLNRAPKWLLAEVERVVTLEGLEREDAIRALCQHAQELDSFTLAQFKEAMQGIGVRAKVVNDLIRVSPTPATDEPFILVDDALPVVASAQGFSDDLGLVTVTLRERTKDNRIQVQPYLVTSTRELIRLTDQQIVTVGGHEVALRDIPSGGDFLRRWRYGDLQHFLAGEAIHPGEVYTTLLTAYIDFGSESDSHILALWTVGTYCYTLFPAYPYLALTGPKNSGKSTVLRVLQPLAFNMVTTSDPTGASLFRLIHLTNCTVGIDEAERYHNPRDPAMQQIRQLLNSGYKAGMPALRLTGDDYRPQAFDVYAPKILAAIAGFEDVLASRCLLLPMQRTMRRLPVFPASFDGAVLRHQLYSLALTYFREVRRSFFEYPSDLANRSGELWSPLLALAAFFEEQGGIAGLRATITRAAGQAEALSDGCALSSREEAVLQALEMLTRDSESSLWIEGRVLEYQVNTILGLASAPLGSSAWIEAVLSRLHLTDRSRRQIGIGGQRYAINRTEVLDLMRRYGATMIEPTKG